VIIPLKKKRKKKKEKIISEMKNKIGKNKINK